LEKQNSLTIGLEKFGAGSYLASIEVNGKVLKVLNLRLQNKTMQLKTIILNGISLLLWGMLIPSLSAQIYSDTTWERWFFGPPHYETTSGVKHVEYYDKGYLLGSSFGDDWGEYAKLIKTDINGYYLWDRTFDTLVFNRVRGISVSDDGSIYCVGFSN
jgi:hypothetical protein